MISILCLLFLYLLFMIPNFSYFPARRLLARLHSQNSIDFVVQKTDVHLPQTPGLTGREAPPIAKTAQAIHHMGNTVPCSLCACRKSRTFEGKEKSCYNKGDPGRLVTQKYTSQKVDLTVSALKEMTRGQRNTIEPLLSSVLSVNWKMEGEKKLLKAAILVRWFQVEVEHRLECEDVSG